MFEQRVRIYNAADLIQPTHYASVYVFRRSFVCSTPECADWFYLICTGSLVTLRMCRCHRERRCTSKRNYNSIITVIGTTSWHNANERFSVWPWSIIVSAFVFLSEKYGSRQINNVKTNIGFSIFAFVREMFSQKTKIELLIRNNCYSNTF